jgi:hypothetical protein
MAFQAKLPCIKPLWPYEHLPFAGEALLFFKNFQKGVDRGWGIL